MERWLRIVACLMRWIIFSLAYSCFHLWIYATCRAHCRKILFTVRTLNAHLSFLLLFTFFCLSTSKKKCQRTSESDVSVWSRFLNVLRKCKLTARWGHFITRISDLPVTGTNECLTSCSSMLLIMLAVAGGILRQPHYLLTLACCTLLLS